MEFLLLEARIVCTVREGIGEDNPGLVEGIGAGSGGGGAGAARRAKAARICHCGGPSSPHIC
jgi:hypothetical protein